MGERVQAKLVSTLEDLVDELLSPQPDEIKVKALMGAVGVPYSVDSIQRISLVFEKMNALVREKQIGKVNYDLSEYS